MGSCPAQTLVMDNAVVCASIMHPLSSNTYRYLDHGPAQRDERDGLECQLSVPHFSRNKIVVYVMGEELMNCSQG